MKTRLSENAIEKLAAGGVAWDSTVPGLMVKRTQGGATFSLYYRAAGIQRRPTLGKWPALSIAGARDAARLMLARIAGGEDPAATAAAKRAEKTIDDLVEEFEKRHFPRLKPRSRESYRHGFTLILAAWSGRRLSAIRRPDVIELHSKHSEIPIKANRMLSFLSAAWNKAEKWEWVPQYSNPTRGVERFPERVRHRLPTEAELKAIGAVVRSKMMTHPDHCACLLLIMATGARGRSEIVTARAEWVTARGLELPDSKSGFKVIPLPERARQIIACLGKTEGRLFKFGPKGFWEWWDKVRREAGAPDLWLHDLRRLFVSVGLNNGLSLGQVGLIVGHASERTTRRYAWLMTKPATEAADAISESISGMIEPQAALAAPEPEAEAEAP